MWNAGELSSGDRLASSGVVRARRQVALTTPSRVVVPVSLGEDSSSSSQIGLSSGMGDTAKDTATAPLCLSQGFVLSGQPLMPVFPSCPALLSSF